MPMFPTSEKALLLPIAETGVAANMEAHDDGNDGNTRIECMLLLATLMLTAFQFFVLYSADGGVPIAFGAQCSALLAQLARGLRISIPASLPTAAMLFLVAPYVAQKERLVMTRYAILACYLVGSTLGSLLLL
ncbi:arginine biosynthesis bifunctional [Pyrenophora seminiperda CCB06]|uniref:Arginine biosynthesis bifunctional n=1 Tax=Pyrenophora seminiperda CCB06 TaxID=1302712 RepID=A0A3M7M8V8_9PLEO|nr:arginine biosynthesis bifunctional [Pyrenophora seminiperda CCB06]